MKNLFHTALAALLLAGMTACEGNSGEETTGGEDKTVTPPYTIHVDKTEIEADGQQAITLTLKDANGKDLTASNQMTYISFEEITSGNMLAKNTRTFTAIKNGTYEFKAQYKSTKSENTVTVTANNRQKYEKYFRNVAVYETTNAYCPACPAMAEGLENTPAEWKQHMVLLAIHGPFDNNDPFILGNAANEIYIRFNKSQAPYPACLYNLDTFVSGSNNGLPSVVAGLLEEQMRKYPATSGIRIVGSEATADGVTINAGFTSTKGGKYDLGYALLLDNQVHAGKEYDHVTVAISPNFISVMNNTAFTAAADTEITKSYSFDKVKLTEDQKANCSVVVFALRSEGTGSVIDNITICKLGESKEYKLNE